MPDLPPIDIPDLRALSDENESLKVENERLRTERGEWADSLAAVAGARDDARGERDTLAARVAGLTTALESIISGMDQLQYCAESWVRVVGEVTQKVARKALTPDAAPVSPAQGEG